MSERFFRVIIGSVLLLALYFKLDQLVYGFIGLLVFEGMTNWRIPTLVSRLLSKEAQLSAEGTYKIGFEAERMFRLVVASLLALTFIVFPEQAWFFPWFIGIMLLLAGVINVCPMILTFRWLGFR